MNISISVSLTPFLLQGMSITCRKKREILCHCFSLIHGFVSPLELLRSLIMRRYGVRNWNSIVFSFIYCFLIEVSHITLVFFYKIHLEHDLFLFLILFLQTL